VLRRVPVEPRRRAATRQSATQVNGVEVRPYADHFGRTYLDPLAPQVVFDATPTHERDGPEAFLGRFAGDLQADAYKGYDALYRTGRMREIGCWAHARRRFVEALPTEARAAPMIALIQQLYQIERAVADESAEIRRARRLQQSAPLLAAVRTEQDALTEAVLPRSPPGEAVRMSAL
jgi:transposase